MIKYNGNEYSISGVKSLKYNGNEYIKQTVIYNISVSTTNITASSSNPTTIEEGSSATLTFTANGTTYKTPTSVTVSGATYTYTRTSDTQCSIVLSNPTANVTVSVVGEAIVTGYNVTFSILGKGADYYVYDGYSTLLGTVSLTSSPVTFTITSGTAYCVPINTKLYGYTTGSYTGGVSINQVEPNSVLLNVTGTGTASITFSTL